MPPKVKTNKDAIVNAAFEVAVKEGIGNITAQRVSSILGTSVAPVFRVFQTIEELRLATAEKIHVFHTDYIRSYAQADWNNGFQTDSDFLSYGLGYIRFAREYPCLFKALTHPGYAPGHRLDEQMSGQLAFIAEQVAAEGSISLDDARDLFYHIWIYTHGIACLVCQGNTDLNEDAVKQLLVSAFHAFLKNYHP